MICCPRALPEGAARGGAFRQLLTTVTRSSCRH